VVVTFCTTLPLVACHLVDLGPSSFLSCVKVNGNEQNEYDTNDNEPVIEAQTQKLPADLCHGFISFYFVCGRFSGFGGGSSNE